MIVSEIEKLNDLLEQKSQVYHEQTNYGHNKEKQSEYDVLFKKLRM